MGNRIEWLDRIEDDGSRTRMCLRTQEEWDARGRDIDEVMKTEAAFRRVLQGELLRVELILSAEVGGRWEQSAEDMASRAVRDIRILKRKIQDVSRQLMESEDQGRE